MTAGQRHSVIIHGHFYQPPREDPWTGEVPKQPSAAPHHDWNQRIAEECYGPITSARILDDRGKERRRMNALAHMSFNFGPTLLSWMEDHVPDVYELVLEADRESCTRFDGHGNAMAMAFHHPILPLSDPRDRTTEVRWGIADFRRRFGRDPEGMWLPETAVDSATLEALAAEGIRFVVLAPHQVAEVPPHGLPGKVVTPHGEVAVFVYDGGLSHGVAFGDLVRDGAALAETLATPLDSDGYGLRSICTDGETFGHHHKFAEMGLAAALDHLESRDEVAVENFASVLTVHPPTAEVELVEPTAWSCAHGVERWRSDCGCQAAPASGSSQAWRGPLRHALTWLASELHAIYEHDGARVLGDPWAARDAYGEVASLGTYSLESAQVVEFLEAHVASGAGPEGGAEAFRLLEMERDTLRFFTSCAWFFDDIVGVEPQQVLAYAAHAIELAGPRGRTLEPRFRALLREAEANDPDTDTGEDVYLGVLEARRPLAGT